MSWFDEAVARRQRAERAAASRQAKKNAGPVEPLVRQQQEVEAFDPLVQRLLGEYGDRVYGRSFTQKRFLLRLERPGKSGEKSWNWHWHLYSLVKHLASVELHPLFTDEGLIRGFELTSGQKRVELASADEDALKEGLVALYMQ